MLGISYGELFLLLGATAALIGPKDLPIIARTAGRLAGRAIGYVQLARGQFENVLQQSQARQVHKELQDTIAQLEAIRHEIRSISIVNPGPLTRRLMDNPELKSASGDNSVAPKLDEEHRPTTTISKDCTPTTSTSANLHSQAKAYARLTDSPVHKEHQDTMAQLEVIRHEIRSVSIINPGLVTGRLMDNPELTSASSDSSVPQKLDEEHRLTNTISKDCTPTTSNSANLHSQATAYARLADSPTLKSGSLKSGGDVENLNDETGLFIVLPVSAESTGLLPNRRDDAKGSDIVLEAILEAEVAQNAKHFFAQHQNQIQSE